MPKTRFSWWSKAAPKRTTTATSVELGPGDTILTGNGDGHAIRCVGDEPLELIAVISTY